MGTDLAGAWRFAATVAGFDPSRLARPSPCTEWTAADVLRHGLPVDETMTAMWDGNTAPLRGFDPRTTPLASVEVVRSLSDLDIRDRFARSSARMAAAAEDAGPDRWGQAAETPAGKVPWSVSVLHAFSDSWLHERDLLQPLGIDPPAPDAESLPVLAWSLALAGIRLTTGDGPTVVGPTGPDPDPAVAQDDHLGMVPLYPGRLLQRRRRDLRQGQRQEAGIQLGHHPTVPRRCRNGDDRNLTVREGRVVPDADPRRADLSR